MWKIHAPQEEPNANHPWSSNPAAGSRLAEGCNLKAKGIKGHSCRKKKKECVMGSFC
jgi:hypothetical protein